MERWTGGKVIDSLWVGDYTVKIKVNPALPDYETSFTLGSQQVKVVELEYGSLDVRVASQTECKLYIGSVEVRRWTGRKIVDSLWTGSYTLKLKVHPSLPEYEDNFTLVNQQVKVVELQYGKLDVRVPVGMECVLLRGTTEMERWTGGKVIDSLWVGDYTVKIKVNPALPDYETSFTLGSQQVKVVEPALGGVIVKTRSDYHNKLVRDGAQIVNWIGSQEFIPMLAGNYTLKSQVFLSLPFVEQNFLISQNEIKTIEWEYGKLIVSGEGANCKLERDGYELLNWSGNYILDSLLTGDYLVEIQKTNSPLWSEEFTLYKDQIKNISIDYGTITININVPTAITKLFYNGVLIKTLTGNGTMTEIIPGNYSMTFEASGYFTQSITINVANGQTILRNINLIKPLMEMVYIPAGTFIMGCTSEQNNCDSDEIPTHQVTLSAYEIAKYEVTQSQWYTVMGTNPSYFSGANKPVEQVDWYEAIDFCNALSIREGLTPVYTVAGPTVIANWYANGYRLPTEAEWEYAARGASLTTNTRYSGSNIIEDVAWYEFNSANSTHNVGTKAPNQLGIYDMSGNVYEWCWDWYSNNYYSTSPSLNPRGPDSGANHVIRGGAWNFVALTCRVANRTSEFPGGAFNDLGLRVVRSR